MAFAAPSNEVTLRQNHTLAALRQGKHTIGLWLHSHSVHIARIIAAQGLFDWLLVDMEHSPLDLSTASMMLSGIADVSSGICTPLARLAAGTMYHVKQALDAGAHGIIVPMVNNAIRRRVNAVRAVCSHITASAQKVTSTILQTQTSRC
jgi:2-keto-3-deoxy-L-rhamnonate aldolase RhmA